MKKYYALAITLIFAILGCAVPKMTQVPETMVLQQPPTVPQAEVRTRPAVVEDRIPVREKERFSLSIRDADIRDVFLLLSKDSGINIIADRDVSGKISIDFTSLELNSALYAITRQMGYTFRMDKGFVRVSRPIIETRAFRVNYITGKRTSTSTMNAAISTSNNAGGISGSGGTNINISSGQQTGSGSSSSSASSSNQGNVNVTTSGTSDFWREIRKGLEVIVFGDSKGSSDTESGFSRGDEKTGKKLIISELAGIIHVTDYSDNMEKVENFLTDVEKAVKKQVMIQAHIIEVSLKDDYKFGINWDAVASFNGLSLNFAQNLKPDSGVFTVDLKSNNVNALLDAMKEQGQVNMLSSPKVSTMNNQRAVIKLTTKEVSWLTNSYFNADGTVLLSFVTPQIDEIGIFLDVTPQIDDNGIITMQIHPSISDKLREAEYVDSKGNKNSKPVIGTREVDTMIKTENGQTIVIAGLIKDTITDTVKKVPLLGDIPVVGAAFKQVIQVKQKSELVILMTPFILTDKSIEDIRKEHEDRLRKAGRTFESVPALAPARTEAAK